MVSIFIFITMALGYLTGKLIEMTLAMFIDSRVEKLTKEKDA